MIFLSTKTTSEKKSKDVFSTISICHFVSIKNTQYFLSVKKKKQTQNEVSVLRNTVLLKPALSFNKRADLGGFYVS